jgi:apolipoprotein N-acyltransferase
LNPWPLLDRAWRWFKTAIVAGVGFLVVILLYVDVVVDAVRPADKNAVAAAGFALAVVAAALGADWYTRAFGRGEWIAVAAIALAVSVFLTLGVFYALAALPR